MKTWYQSKTLVVNVLTMAAGVIAALQGSEFITQNPTTVAFLAVVLGGVNVLLRLVTSLPIGTTTDAT